VIILLNPYNTSLIVEHVRDVFVALQFLETPSDALVAPNSNHTFKCNVSSLLPVAIAWFKDGNELEITLDGHWTTRNNGMELIITGVQRGSDEGTYFCEVSNTSLGSVRSLGGILKVACKC